MNVELIKEKLTFLKANPNRLNSLIPKNFFINPVISETEVLSVENEEKIKFPKDYREFITKIGNGCIGPDYGLLSLQESMIDFKLDSKPRIDLSRPFHYSEGWNENWIFDIDWDSGERPEDEQLERYMNVNHINGCLQICHIGHGCTYLLVVNGDEYGYIWTDERADYGGINPLVNEDGSKVTFEDWYVNWLEEVISR